LISANSIVRSDGDDIKKLKTYEVGARDELVSNILLEKLFREINNATFLLEMWLPTAFAENEKVSVNYEKCSC